METNSSKEEGLKYFQKRKYELAIQSFQKYLDECLESGDDVNAAEMRNNLCVTYLKLKQGQLALESVLGSDLVFENIGDFRKQGMAVANTATALESVGRYEEALVKYENALEILRKINDKELSRDIWRRISDLQIKTRRGYQAVASIETSLENSEKNRGKTLGRFLTSLRKKVLGQK